MKHRANADKLNADLNYAAINLIGEHSTARSLLAIGRAFARYLDALDADKPVPAQTNAPTLPAQKISRVEIRRVTNGYLITCCGPYAGPATHNAVREYVSADSFGALAGALDRAIKENEMEIST